MTDFVHPNVAAALASLYNMRAIVENDRLVKGNYVDEFDPALSTSICQGHKYCAIGSLWAGNGQHPTKGNWGWSLDGVGQWQERVKFLADKPDLTLAYTALNAAAHEYIYDNDIEFGNSAYEFDAHVEQLFEEAGEGVGRDVMLAVIDKAVSMLESVNA